MILRFVAYCSDLGAATPEVPAELSLAQACSLAMERNWDLLAAKANVDLATAQKLIAHEFPNPTLSWSTTNVNVDEHSSATPAGHGLWNRNYDTTTAINQLLEIGGKRALRQRSAEAGLEAAKSALQDARRLLDLGVSTAYIAVLLADENARILRDTAKSLRDEADISKERLRAGDMSESDRAQIEIAAERAELDALAAQTASKTARVQVEVLLGVHQPRGAWKPVDTLEKLTGSPVPKRDVDSADISRPDVTAAEAALRKAEQDVLLQKAMRIPDPTVLVQYEHVPPDQPNTIGIGISIPLPLWNSNKGNIKAAEATRDQAIAQLGKVRSLVAADVATAKLMLGDARTRWTRYRDDVQPKSAKTLEIISYAYKKGGTPLVALLQAARTDNEVRLATAQAMAESANAAAALRAAQNIVHSPATP